MLAMGQGTIEPEVDVEAPPVTVSMSALVDDLCVMHYEVNEDGVSIYLGTGTDDSIHIGFTDQSIINLARLANQAVCATLRARGIPIPVDVGQEQPGV